MNIFTNKVKDKVFHGPISSELFKHSQEYRALATLRYCFPGQYETMSVSESPDLQDKENDVGIEVTVAVQGSDMQATDAFSKLRHTKDNAQQDKLTNLIRSCGFSIDSMPCGIPIISTAGTSEGEKYIFQKSLINKLGKLQDYKNSFNTVGLVMILKEIPTTEAENNLIEWIQEVNQEENDFYDFIYIISCRFCIYFENKTNYSLKRIITKAESELLQTIGRMTAEKELTLESQEWKEK